MKQILNLSETAINIAGIAVSVQDLESALSLALLIVSIASMLIRGIYTVYKHIKNKDIEAAVNTTVEVLDDTKKIIEKHNMQDNKEEDKNGKV